MFHQVQEFLQNMGGDFMKVSLRYKNDNMQHANSKWQFTDYGRYVSF